MVNEPFVDPPRPPTEEQKRMLIEAGRDYHMHGTQRYESETQRYADPVVYSEEGLLCLEGPPRPLRRIRRLGYTAPRGRLIRGAMP